MYFKRSILKANKIVKRIFIKCDLYKKVLNKEKQNVKIMYGH